MNDAAVLITDASLSHTYHGRKNVEIGQNHNEHIDTYHQIGKSRLKKIGTSAFARSWQINVCIWKRNTERDQSLALVQKQPLWSTCWFTQLSFSHAVRQRNNAIIFVDFATVAVVIIKRKKKWDMCRKRSPSLAQSSLSSKQIHRTKINHWK